MNAKTDRDRATDGGDNGNAACVEKSGTTTSLNGMLAKDKSPAAIAYIRTHKGESLLFLSTGQPCVSRSFAIVCDWGCPQVFFLRA